MTHWRTSTHVAACARPALLADLRDDLGEVTCDACLELAAAHLANALPNTSRARG